MNANQRIVNDMGLGALKGLAQSDPKLFLDADPDTLETRMKERAETEKVWGPPLGLLADLSPMNDLDRQGPGTDAAFAPRVRAALRDLPPSEGLNEHRWATINCFAIPQYVVKRWQTSNLANNPKRHPDFVADHWLRGATVGARQDNAVARLWWLGELSDRAGTASERHDADAMLNAMAGNVNLYHQLLYRPLITSRPQLIAAIYEVFMEEENRYLRTTKYANPLFRNLLQRSARVSFDLMSAENLRQIVEEAKPPKGAGG